ncbi:hypothetical protein Tco_0832382, partial [Tanacetum coccineum]
MEASITSDSVWFHIHKDVVLMGLILTMDMRWIVCACPSLNSILAVSLTRTPPPKAQNVLACALFSEIVKSLGVSFDLSPRQKAVVECLRAPRAQNFLTVIPIEGLGQHMSALEYRTILKYRLMIPLFPVDDYAQLPQVCLDFNGEHAVHCKELPGFKYRHDLVRDVLYDVLKRAGISSRKEAPVNFLTDPLEGRLYWSVPSLFGLGTWVIVAGQAALKAESSKVAKHEKACLENQHVFIPFAFDTFGFLAPEAEEFLNRMPWHKRATLLREKRDSNETPALPALLIWATIAYDYFKKKLLALENGNNLKGRGYGIHKFECSRKLFRYIEGADLWSRRLPNSKAFRDVNHNQPNCFEEGVFISKDNTDYDRSGIVNNTYRPALSSDCDRGSSNSYVSLPVDCTLHLKLPVWENLKAILFVLDATLTTCAHGRLSPLDLTTDTIADKAQMNKQVDMDRVLSQMVLTD